MLIKNMSHDEFYDWISDNSGLGMAFDPMALIKGEGDNSPSDRFNLYQSLNKYPESSSRKWCELERGVPVMKIVLHDMYTSKGEYPNSFHEFGMVISNLVKNNASLRSDYHLLRIGNDEEERAIAACGYYRGCSSLNADIKERGAMGFVAKKIKEFNMDSFAIINDSVYNDVYGHIDIPVINKNTKEDLLRGHCRAGYKSKIRSKQRRNSVGYKWVTGLDVEITCNEFKNDRSILQIGPDTKAQKQISEILLCSNGGVPF